VSVLTVNSRQARTDLRDLLDRVFSGNADIVIERYGKPVAVMIPFEDYEEIREELEDLRTGRRVAKIYETWKGDSSTARPMEAIEAELAAEGLLDE